MTHFEPPVYRGCAICTHGVEHDGARYCAAASVTGGRRPIEVTRARAHGGACGPEAEHLDFPGLRDFPASVATYRLVRQMA